ncbi:MAG: iolC 1 [Herbinix sp.]|jgi:ribokinase|nr:iolC 1 [Herbinix sp.]
MEKRWDVFVYGDVNIDIVIPGVEHLPLPGQEDVVNTMNTYVGGGAALFTLGLGKLGLSPVFQGSLGDDIYGKYIIEEFEAKHVDCSLINTSTIHKTGISISFTNEKDRSFLTYRGTNDELSLSKIEISNVIKARHIHVTGYAGSKNHDSYLRLLQQIKEKDEVTVSFDIGWDDSGEWYEGIYQLFPYIDVLFMNETEAVHYGRRDTFREAMYDFAKYCPMPVIKLGKQGSIALVDGNEYRANPYSVIAVDTTGAGDSFNAGFIYGYLRGKSVEECLKFGNACGALSVTAYGGNAGFPTEKQLHDFMKEQNERTTRI